MGCIPAWICYSTHMSNAPRYNAGHRFEMDLAASFGVSSPISGHGSDLDLGDYSVEVKKSLDADFGQGTMMLWTQGWESVAVSAHMRRLFEVHMADQLNAEWGTDGWAPGMPEVYVEIPELCARRYYTEKGDAYIYIGSHGLYRTGIKDPANTGAPLLRGTQILRARIKCNSKSRNHYSPNYSIRIKNLEKSPIGIDALR